MRVKIHKIRRLYVLIVYQPRSRKKIAARRTSRNPFREIAAGDIVRVRGVRLRVRSIAARVEERDGVAEQITELFTAGTRTRVPSNVIRMPTGDQTIVAQFIRYHVLIRVFGGDPDAWLARLQESGRDEDGGDLRFVRWIRSRMRQDPTLLASIRRMVDATPFWRVAEA
jgi:hypothetical protein